jgi:hypothetical protein
MCSVDSPLVFRPRKINHSVSEDESSPESYDPNDIHEFFLAHTLGDALRGLRNDDYVDERATTASPLIMDDKTSLLDDIEKERGNLQQEVAALQTVKAQLVSEIEVLQNERKRQRQEDHVSFDVTTLGTTVVSLEKEFAMVSDMDNQDDDENYHDDDDLLAFKFTTPSSSPRASKTRRTMTASFFRGTNLKDAATVGVTHCV